MTPIPTPYRDPFWETLSQESEVDLSVVYCATGKSDRPWNSNQSEFTFQRHFPDGKNLARFFGWGHSCYWNPAIQDVLKSCRPDIVLIGGYNHLTLWTAAKYCRRHDIPWLLMCESWKARKLKERPKNFLLRRWLRSAAGALPTGTLAAERLERLGIPAIRQCRVPNVPDVQKLRLSAKEWRQKHLDVRQELGMPITGRIIVFAGRLIPKKRPLLLIEAISGLSEMDDVNLVMIGDGPLRADAEKLAAKLRMDERVKFLGFLKPQMVHQAMAVADLFVMPSAETWGVAPIESLACSTPIVITREMGCHADLKSSTKMVTTVPIDDLDSLCAAISRGLQENEESGFGVVEWLNDNDYQSISKRLIGFLKVLSDG